ncbi:phosphoadenosine phosphosulfate reductase [Lutimaribacter pacificus]|uniref:Adenosine 5'-phosphosulfate reductase n=1 Tax=Lutimaribacter pacificus TaxID=391948 RepID=A0A1H0IWG0_9RHOB|nr:phosphoadenylyl-sulfate reductase [Lutimaribacter pacificus]SDO35796.1 phosphoadenosine phosphosulfate reductase [Lutimaribacter pacificus]SHK16790.1 phosphoadenylylsulfate reductase (thioredoxin) [Lutimaribacter pacificus]
MLQSDLAERTMLLNTRFASAQAHSLLEAALLDRQFGRVALVSSFGVEAAVLLHMVADIDPRTPVLFIDTEMLFEETLTYQRDLSARLGLSDVRVLRADPSDVATADPRGLLHQSDPDTCCALRKTVPLQNALKGFDAWISGRKRYQGGKREALQLFEAETGTGRVKLNPLANWTGGDMQAYMNLHDLPRHPLVARGYGSVGCAPCTVPAEGREGRWKGREKTECGIHFENGRMVKTGAIA